MVLGWDEIAASLRAKPVRVGCIEMQFVATLHRSGVPIKTSLASTVVQPLSLIETTWRPRDGSSPITSMSHEGFSKRYDVVGTA